MGMRYQSRFTMNPFEGHTIAAFVWCQSVDIPPVVKMEVISLLRVDNMGRWKKATLGLLGSKVSGSSHLFLLPSFRGGKRKRQADPCHGRGVGMKHS